MCRQVGQWTHNSTAINTYMANHITEPGIIKVHGRGSLLVHYKVYDKKDGTQEDLSGLTIYFEVDGLEEPIRKLLVPDETDPKGQKLILTRTDVEKLSSSPCRYSYVDETDIASDMPRVFEDGEISMLGYSRDPDNIRDGG